MVAFLTWLVLIEAIGLLALPLAYRLFSALPDRGYTFTKPLGILIPAYLFWLAAMAGLLENSRVTIAVVFVVFGLASWGLARISWAELSAFLRQRWRFIAFSEGLFIAAFAGWSLFRAYDPAITATEKPMEIAFLNAILRSETLPPLDPWLSGFAISYYYFGYLMMAMLTKLSGIASAITFNLSLALLFALTVTASFGLVYNWVASAGRARWRGVPVAFGLLGALFVAFLGNLEGVWEVLRSNGVLPTSFFRWLGIVGLDQPPPQIQLYPTDPPEIWWWWRASRVIGSVNPATNTPTDYTINEFPFFSFLLGDLHPHVLALPFNLLALGLCLALVVRKDPIDLAWLKRNWPLAGLAGVILGALGFLNFWDLPTYLAAFIVAFIIHRVVVAHIRPERALGVGALLGVAALVASFLLYLPFYYGFSSQASGIGLVFIRSRLPQFLTIWALFLLIAVPFLIFVFIRGIKAIPEGWDRPLPIVVAVASLILALAVGLLLQAEVAALLLAFIGLTIAGLLAKGFSLREHASSTRESLSRGEAQTLFAVGLIMVAFLLLMGCEFVFIRDTFGTRMNTVFKLYYQAWVLLGVSGAYALYSMTVAIPWRSALARIGGFGWVAAIAVLFLGSLIYPAIALPSKAHQFGAQPTLDGSAWIEQANTADYQAIQWLGREASPRAVVLEATGPQYSFYGRVASYTGLPTVLGWLGHELQWRGTAEEASRRVKDIETIYQTTDLAEAKRLLEKYNVYYVYVGSLERTALSGAPPSALTKFQEFMDIAYNKDGVTIYQARERAEG